MKYPFGWFVSYLHYLFQWCDFQVKLNVNKHNAKVWETENPHEQREIAKVREEGTVWCKMFVNQAVSPCYFDLQSSMQRATPIYWKISSFQGHQFYSQLLFPATWCRISIQFGSANVLYEKLTSSWEARGIPWSSLACLHIWHLLAFSYKEIWKTMWTIHLTINSLYWKER